MYQRRVSMRITEKQRKLKLLNAELGKVVDLPEISIPGVQNLYKAISFHRKIVWFVALCFCLFIALFQIEDRIEYFINGGVAVRVSVDQNEKLDLPDITICPPRDVGKNIEISRLMSKYKDEFKENATGVLDLLRLPQMNLIQLWEMTKLEHSGILIKSLNATITNNFTYHYWPSIYGTCITLHKKEKFPTFLLPGILFELTATGWDLPNPYENISHILAYKVILHDYALSTDDVGVDGHWSLGFYRLTLHYKISKYSFLNTRKSPCTPDGITFQKCRASCLKKKLIQRLRCRMPYLSLDELPICEDVHESKVSNETTYTILSELNWNQCSCPHVCSGLSFSSSYDLSPMVSNKPSFLRILFKFQDNTVDSIVEYNAYTVVSLLCDVGAILGLMLGVCILTFMQVVEVGFYFIRRKIIGEHKSKKKNIIKVSAIAH